MIPNFRGLTKGETHRRGQRNNFIAPVALAVLVMLIGQGFWLTRNSHMFMPFEVSRVDCMECGRLGTVRDPDNQRIRTMCPACYGIGYHSVRRFDEKDALCLACAGIGRLKTDEGWRTCRRCDGRGMHRIGDWKEIVELEEAELEVEEATSNFQHSTSNFQNTVEDQPINHPHQPSTITH